MVMAIYAIKGSMLPILFLLALGILIGVFVLVNKKHKESEYYKQTGKSLLHVYSDRGSSGEFSLSNRLNSIAGYKKMIYNCYIPKADGTTTEIDVLMIHEKGIYVFESKNYSGWIFGTEDQQYWTQSFKGRGGRAKKFKFYNPIMQNNAHTKWLSKYLSSMNLAIPIYSCIVFGNDCELKNITLTSNKHAVVNEMYLANVVQNHIDYNLNVLTNSDIDAIYAKLFPLTQASEIEKIRHVENIYNYKNSGYNHNTYYQSNAKTEDRICKKCGCKMILRTAKKGENAGKTFFGCSNYPTCKYIEKID